MPKETIPPSQNWFARHPAMTLSAVLVVLVVFLTILTEKILAWRQPEFHDGIQRYIRLREYRPYFFQYILPPAAELALADNLEVRPYLLRIDGDGFIIPSRIHPEPELSLVFLGGSSTACGYMGETERFPYLVGRLVEERTGKKVNSYNSGVGGNNSWHSLNILMNKVIPLKPDIVLLCHNINDLTILLLEGTYWSDNPSRSQIVTVMPSLGGSFREIRDLLLPNLTREVNQLSKTLKQKFRRQKNRQPDEFARVRGQQIHYDEARLRAAFRRNLELFLSVCRLHQLQPVLLTQAHRLKETPEPIIKASLRDLEERQGLPYTEYRRLFLAFNEEIRAVGRENGVLVIDLAAAIPPEKEYLYDIVHFTGQGSRQAAALISNALLGQIVAQPSP